MLHVFHFFVTSLKLTKVGDEKKKSDADYKEISKRNWLSTRVDVTADIMKFQKGLLWIRMRLSHWQRSYEEKYKQYGDVAFKLTIEEAVFHDRRKNWRCTKLL